MVSDTATPAVGWKAAVKETRAALDRGAAGVQVEVGTQDPELDGEARSAYFRQAAYGVPVRMATIALLLGIAEEEWSSGWGARGQATSTPVSAGGDLPVERSHSAVGVRCAKKAFAGGANSTRSSR